MLIQLNFQEDVAIVIKEASDPKIYSDSAFYYRLKKELIALEFDCIKKKMWKDGYLVSDGEYYIRDRKGKWCMWNPNYQVRSAYEDFNEGKLELRIE